MSDCPCLHTDGSIWVRSGNHGVVEVIDQRYLPFKQLIFGMMTLEDSFYAIREMVVRGAPLIGVTAAFGMYLALRNNCCNNKEFVEQAADYLNSTRPTAVNLFFATERMVRCFNENKSKEENIGRFFREASDIREEEINSCRKIGEAGLPLIEAIWQQKKPEPVQILTHCNAGWLACVKYGTATSPVYLAHEKGIPVHVWVDETRPRNQGARLTAYELGLAGIPHTIIPDNAGGHLMQHGMVDLVLVGSDRTTLNGDVANKTGTYLKALAASDNHIPFYAALPSSTFDWNMEDGVKKIPVEERSPGEVAAIEGWDGKKIIQVRLIPENSAARNFGFDVTPARLVTGLITERGICTANKEGILQLFPEKADTGRLAEANGNTI
jgi:methylthioribose-1-phosphate isomerase